MTQIKLCIIEISEQNFDILAITYIKNIFKVGAKMAKKNGQNFFFDPPKNEKPSVQKVPLQETSH